MKNRERDRLYCGANENVRCAPTINEENFKLFVHFIKERYRIHKRKDVKKQSPPFTKDPILQKYKFTNVRREHDRQSKELIQRVSTNGKLSMEDKIVNTFLFRAWNNADTFEFFDLPLSSRYLYRFKAKDDAKIKYLAYKSNHPAEFEKRRWWSSAYNQGGTKGAWKFPDGEGWRRAKKDSDASSFQDFEKDIPLRPFHIPPWLKQADIVNKILSAKDQQEVFNIIKTVRGFADFLAYQIFVDLTYIPEFPFSENEFVVAGPGCRKGIDLIFANRDGMDYSTCIFWIRDNFDELCNTCGTFWVPMSLFSDLPEHDRCLNVMSIENCFCEISKYIRTYNGEGRPKVNYKATERKNNYG